MPASASFFRIRAHPSHIREHQSYDKAPARFNSGHLHIPEQASFQTNLRILDALQLYYLLDPIVKKTGKGGPEFPHLSSEPERLDQPLP